MKYVFILDQNLTPLAPCSAWKARKLLKEKKASVYRYFPYTIRLFSVVENPVTPKLRLKIDPGSRFTGFAIVNDETGEVIWAAEIEHRGLQVRSAMESRASLRRGRRARKTRYRQPRFDNRTRKAGWLPPSLESRIANVETWVQRIWKIAPLTALSMELVRFDMQKMMNPEISGVEYQQGVLAGYEVREYLLEKWKRECSYCGAKGVKLQVEHIHPRARGGSNRVSNLCLACEPCNQAKGTRLVEEFLKTQPKRLKKIQEQAKAPLHDAAAVNTTRWALLGRLEALGLPVETGSGGLTKFNRVKRELPKFHWTDAACVGLSTPPMLQTEGVNPLRIKAAGHGKRQRCGTDARGFPIRHAPRKKHFLGFQTGDIVKAVIPSGKYKGTHIGRIAIRFRPKFKLNDFDVHPKYLRVLQKADGYSYAS